MKRRYAAVVVIVGLAVTVVATWPRGPRPCRATFEQVLEGMTFAEVCATVGGPPGDYARGDVICSSMVYEKGSAWWTDDAELCVHFDAQGRADLVSVGGVISFRKPSVIERLRDWLGL
jgi:hypothetical protein